MLEIHSNDVSREAKPGIWIFRGRSLVFLVIGAGLAVAILQTLYAYGVDWYLGVPISLIPLVSMGAVLALFVNGRPESYLSDLLLSVIWRFKTWLYLHGLKDRASELWITDRPDHHPKEF